METALFQGTCWGKHEANGHKGSSWLGHNLLLPPSVPLNGTSFSLSSSPEVFTYDRTLVAMAAEGTSDWCTSQQPLGEVIFPKMILKK